MKISLTIKQLIGSGIYIGHQKNRWNIKMSSYILGFFNEVSIINIEYTITTIKLVLNLIKEVIVNKGKLLIISDQYHDFNNILSKIDNKYVTYMFNNQISNGFLTNNRNIIKDNIIPNVIIIFSINNYSTIIKEAIKLKIPVVTLTNINNDPSNITYPIPGNNDSIQSIQLLNNLINNVITLASYEQNIFFKYKYKIFRSIY